MGLDGDDLEGEVFEAEQWIPGVFASTGLHLPLAPGFGADAGIRVHGQRALVNDQSRFLLDVTGRVGVTVSLRTRKVARARRAD